ncbi:MAG: hypothetical protein IT204_24030 [Fimbriimonadaceae bacterium]|nr:hypothetical protein [Fimbriimonadaceae bacterium]
MTGVWCACVLLLAAEGEPAMQPREWAAAVSLEAVTVVAPLETEVGDLLAAVRRAGGQARWLSPTAAVVPGTWRWLPELRRGTVVVVGQLADNLALWSLYGRYLALGDLIYPGGDGWTLRSSAAPWGVGSAVVTCEASSPAGRVAALAALTARVAAATPGELPVLLEVQPGSGPGGATPGQRWFLRGDQAAARQAVAALLGAADPQTGYAALGDYGIEAKVREYCLLQDAPVCTAAEVQRLDQALLLTLLATEREYWRGRAGREIGGRHQIMGTSCFGLAVELLRRRGRPNAAAAALLERWWGEVRDYWQNALQTWHDDGCGIPSYYAPQTLIDWCWLLEREDWWRQQLPWAARRALAATDSQGAYAGDGTYEECRPGMLTFAMPNSYVFRAAAAAEPQFGWLGLAQSQPSGAGMWAVGRDLGGARTFAVPSTTAPPREPLGAAVVPLGAYRWERAARDRATAERTGQRLATPPLERCFEKLTCRDGWDPRDGYLLLQGWVTPLADNVRPDDANSIVRYADLGHTWLHANCPRQGNLHRTALHATAGRGSGVLPAAAELLALQPDPRLPLAVTRLSDAAGVTWTRHLAWLPQVGVVLLDLARRETAGERVVVATFRTPCAARAEGPHVVLTAGLESCRLQTVEPSPWRLSRERDDRGAAVSTLLRQMQPLPDQPGATLAWRTAVTVQGPQRPTIWEARALGERALLLHGSDGRLVLVAAALAGETLRIGPFAAAGRLLAVATHWAVAGAAEWQFAGAPVRGTHGETTAAMRQALQRLWEQTAPVGAAAGPAEAPALATHGPGFSPLAPLIDAPLLSADPAGSGSLPALVDRVLGAAVAWPAGQTVNLTIDLREPQPVGSLELIAALAASQNARPEAAAAPAPRRIEVVCSNDGFQADQRRRQVSCRADLVYEDLHKGIVFAFRRWRSEALGESARQVRLTFAAAQWPEGLTARELTVRGVQPGTARLNSWRLADSDGDGQPELLRWSEAGELLITTLAGELRCRRQMPAYLTDVTVAPDLLPGGPHLLATARDANLYCLRPDGSEVWRCDLLPTAAANADCPTGWSVGTLHDSAGRPLILVGNYHLQTFVSPQGQILKWVFGGSAYQTATLAQGLDGTADGVEETLSAGIWGGLSLLDGRLQRRAVLGVPGGRTVLLEAWREPQPAAICVTDGGVAAVDLRRSEVTWRYLSGPVTSAAAADLDGDGQREVVLGQEDGFLVVLAADGSVRAQRWLGQPVQAVAARSGELAAVLADRLLRLHPDLRTAQEVNGRASGAVYGPDGRLTLLGPDGRVGRLPG